PRALPKEDIMRLLTVALSYVALIGCFTSAIAQEKSSKKTAEVEEGFTSIFNGKDLDGWKGNTELWSVEDGLITGRTTAEKPLQFNTFLIYANGPVANFELRLDYKIEAGNSGIQYRSKVIDEQKFIVGGYQADMEAGPTYSGINYEEQGRGILAERGQRVTIAADGSKAVEQFGDRDALAKKLNSAAWNHYRVVANGN